MVIKATIENMSDMSDSELEETLKNSRSAQLALEVATFIGNRYKETTCISNTHDGLYMVDYALNGILQPTIRIDGQKVIIPAGTQEDLLEAYLNSIMGGKHD